MRTLRTVIEVLAIGLDLALAIPTRARLHLTPLETHRCRFHAVGPGLLTALFTEVLGTFGVPLQIVHTRVLLAII